ncbi:MAG: alkaline phosphatase family protein [Candidatus Marinimicrobia bacterium]|nr:alkaline phosphatase family protein [Candidatus Neomarinimicrobiota bacterium]
MKKGKVIVFGLDGATWNILRPMMDAGLLPNFSRVAKEGVWGTLKSTIPPVTPPAWATFVTGKNPGKHGLFGFVVNKHRADVETTWANEYAIKTNKIWDLLDHLGRTSALINIPITYPAKKINGWYVSGFLTPQGAKDVTYPPDLLEELNKKVDGYVINVASGSGASIEDAKKFTKANVECTRKRTDAMFHIWDKYDPDLNFPVYVGPDRIQHRYYGYLDPSNDAYNSSEASEIRDIITENYTQLDAILGEILAKMDENTTLLVASDHGFGVLESYVSINLWLAEKGYLKYKKSGAWLREIDKKFGISNRLGNMKRLQANLTFDAKLEQIIIMKETIAYAGDVYEEGIFLNVKGRQEHGIVEPGEEYEKIRDEIIEGLKEINFPGTTKPLFSELLKKEDVYHGKYLDDAPDIVVVVNNHKSLITNNLPALKSKFVRPPKNVAEGTHEPDGIFMAWGASIKPDSNFGEYDIHDMTPTILHAMGEPYFSDMDGKPIYSIFSDETTTEPAEPLSEADVDQDVSYSDEEQKEIEERLRSLGYID